MYRYPIYVWALLAVALAAAVLVLRDGVTYMWQVWQANEEYSHVYVIPFISAFLVWQRRDELATMEFRGSWWGFAVVLAGLAIGVIGQMSAVYTLQQIALVVIVWGVVLALVGWRVVRTLWMPLLLLLFIIPLPRFMQVNLSANLQLWSSALGVLFIRLMGISVYLEGNVIDLGTYKLQVVEACDGLRYLFPLMTIGLVMAYFYKGALWKRVLIFASSIPITILMNSLRIGMIGWMVEHWGPSMAEGFLHDFQGWAVFMASFVLMVLLMAGLSLVGRDRKPWRELFGIELPPAWPKGTTFVRRAVPMAALVSCVALVSAAVAATALPERADEAVPARTAFVDFPMIIGTWLGQRHGMDPQTLDALKLNDYLMAQYAQPGGSRSVNLYVAWYDSQRAGRSVHSPRTCLPGGGWRIVDFRQIEVPGVEAAGQPLRVNRALIGLGSEQQLVYYWFQQRGRIITNEYLAKWYLFWDSLTRNRTDGALVRLAVTLPNDLSSSTAEQDLVAFAREIEGVIEAYVPR